MSYFDEIDFDLKNEDIISILNFSQDSILYDDLSYFSGRDDDETNSNDHDTINDYKNPTISDKELLETPIKHLNTILKSKSDLDSKCIKKKRRQLKNRLYARESRSRKQIQKLLCESESGHLMSEIKRLQTIVDQLKHERDYYKDRCRLLQVSMADSC